MVGRRPGPGRAIAAVPVFALALAAPHEARAERTALVVCALLLAGLTIARLGHALAGDDYLEGGGTFSWMLALFTAVSGFLYSRTRAVVAVLITALAAVALVLELVNWIFDAEDIDVFRVLLAVAFAALFAAGLATAGRVATLLVAAAGIVALSGFYVVGLGLLFGAAGGLGWGWELIALLEGAAPPPTRPPGSSRAPRTSRSSCSCCSPARRRRGACAARAIRSPRRRRSRPPARRSPALAGCRAGRPRVPGGPTARRR
jgi:hypothetical protein